MSWIRSISFACTVAGWLVVSPLTGVAADKSEAASASIPKAPNIANFGRISDTYYRGEQPDGRDFADLAALGVKLVIDLQRDGPAGERQAVEAAGMKFYRIPMTTRKAPTSEQLEQFLQLVNDGANQPVYVHCAGGRHRTGVMTAVYRMTHDGWTPEQAFKEMKQYDFGADFLHPEFKQFVYGYRAEPARALNAPQILEASAAN